MKNFLSLLIMSGTIAMFLVMASVTLSCEPPTSIYPRYTLKTITNIPDSIKVAHREWITETVRAASENMTGGDYEDVNETILQVERTATRIFGVDVIVLNKEINDKSSNDIIISSNQFTNKEKLIFNKLRQF